MSDLMSFVGILQKAGARHSKSDMGNIQQAHDSIAALCDGALCGPMTKGQRHSNKDMSQIKAAHAATVALGATCSMKS